jgi:hypothetical protein
VGKAYARREHLVLGDARTMDDFLKEGREIAAFKILEYLEIRPTAGKRRLAIFQDRFQNKKLPS